MDNPIVKIQTGDLIEKEILEMYWELDEEYKFLYSFDEIKTHFKEQKSTREIQQLVKEKSILELFCDKCGTLILTANNRSSANSFWSSRIEGKFHCSDCPIENLPLNFPSSTTNEERINSAMLLAIDSEEWKNLDVEILKTLITISRCTTKKQIFDALFKTAPFKSPYGQILWQRINYLANSKLIWIKRDGKRIVEIIVHEKMKHLLSEEYPEIFENELDISKDFLRIALHKNFNNDFNKPFEPHFKGTFMFSQTIELIKNIPYSYEATINDDGSISLTILPRYEQDKIDYDINTFSPEVIHEFEKVNRLYNNDNEDDFDKLFPY